MKDYRHDFEISGSFASCSDDNTRISYYEGSSSAIISVRDEQTGTNTRILLTPADAAALAGLIERVHEAAHEVRVGMVVAR